MHCVAWIQIVLPWTTANRISPLPTHCSHRAFSCRRLSSRTAHTKVCIPISRAFRAEPIGFGLRGIAPTECAILPVRELAVCPGAARANVPAQGSAPRRVGPCRRPVLDDGFSWQPDQVPWCGSSGQGTQPLLRANGQYLRLRTRSLEVGFGCGWRLLPGVSPGPMLQPAVPFWPRLLLRELILAHSPSDPRSLPTRGSPLTKSDWLCLRGVAHTECDIVVQATVNY